MELHFEMCPKLEIFHEEMNYCENVDLGTTKLRPDQNKKIQKMSQGAECFTMPFSEKFKGHIE